MRVKVRARSVYTIPHLLMESHDLICLRVDRDRNVLTETSYAQIAN